MMPQNKMFVYFRSSKITIEIRKVSLMQTKTTLTNLFILNIMNAFFWAYFSVITLHKVKLNQIRNKRRDML